MRRYFRELNGAPARGVYAMVLNEIERPLLRTVMQHAANNQSEAAKILGVNRNTLRKKLAQHDIKIP